MSRLRIIPLERDIIEEVALITGGDASLYKDTCIIFQGKRPLLYLKKKLAALHGTTAFFPPLCMSLDQFVDTIAGIQDPLIRDIDRMDAVWLIYDLIVSLPEFERHPFRKEGFGEFFRWGLYLLNFIDRLDMEEIDGSSLVNIEKNAAIGYDVPQSINQLLANISVLREEFHARLSRNGWLTRGLKHLSAARALRDGAPLTFDHIIFAGLFGLAGTERKIVKTFWDSGNSTVILSGNPDDWPVLKEFVSYLKATPEHEATSFARPVVHVHSGHDSHAEVLEAYRIITTSEPGKTAIVLPNPDPLFPLLTFVVDRIAVPCNVSLGYPIERTSLFDLVRRVINSRIEMRQDGRYPASRYLGVMTHPFIKNLFPETALRQLILNIERFLSGDLERGTTPGKAIVSLGEIEAAFPQIAAGIEGNISLDRLSQMHALLFGNFIAVSTAAEMAERIADILDVILSNTPIRSYVLSGPVFESLSNALDSLKGGLYAHAPLNRNPVRNIRAVCDLALYHIGGATLPFDTHPVEDIEVLGMLEARNIAFERVIVLDVNEGVLPGPREINPVIPLGVFEMLGIPSPEFTESIYRYNFYRLIASAQDVHLVYRTQDETPRSRYIEEIIWAEEKRQRKLDIIPVDRSVFPVNLRRDLVTPTIGKTPAALDAILNRGISPSSLDAYVSCPLLFYFTRLLRLEDRRAFSDDMDAAERGELIHAILHETFLPHLGMPLNGDSRKEIVESLNRAIESRLPQPTASGQLYMFRRLVSYKLRSFVDKSFENITDPLCIEYVEEKFNTTIDVKGIPVILTGKIDRVDKNIVTGRYRIIDYKTGIKQSRYSAKVLDKADFDDIISIHENVPSFQLPLYLMMFSLAKKIDMKNLDASLLFLGNNQEEDLFKKSGDDERRALMEGYTQGIRTAISDMLDPGKPFAAFDTKKCAQCPARDLCHV